MKKFLDELTEMAKDGGFPGKLFTGSLFVIIIPALALATAFVAVLVWPVIPLLIAAYFVGSWIARR